MWQVIVDFLTICGYVMLGVAAVIAIGLGVLFVVAVCTPVKQPRVDLSEAVRERNPVEMIKDGVAVKCVHGSTTFLEDMPCEAWRCNDCGRILV